MRIERFGAPDELRLIEAPKPGPYDVLVRVAYASINPADWKSRAGLLPHLKTYALEGQTRVEKGNVRGKILLHVADL